MASSSRHFFNDPTELVNAALQAQTSLNPSLSLDAEHRVLYTCTAASAQEPDRPRQTVHVLSGGGSGHEPSFAGLVGQGLLSASVAGSIFASPSTKQVLRGIELLAGRGDDASGVCVIVMNYTGDVLNFGLAVEKARAAGLNVAMVIVGDDVGVGRAKGGKVGRRGIAGTCLVHKIASALAASGASLADVAAAARLAATNIVSVAAALSHVHVPGRSAADEAGAASLQANEVELGMGIHNEDGSARLQDVALPALVRRMLAQMLDAADADRAFLRVAAQDETVLLVNNLGGLSPLELGGVVHHVTTQLEADYGIRPKRILAGTLMTSLNGLGFSISLLKCVALAGGQSMLDLLDAPVDAAGWLSIIKPSKWASPGAAKTQGEATSKQGGKDKVGSNYTIKYTPAVTALTTALKRVIAAEPDITKYDTVVGDGDCGVGLERGAKGIIAELNNGYTTTDVAILLDRIINTVESTMDGTSGALYAIFLNALVASIRSQSPAESGNMTVEVWARSLEQALLALRKYTPARRGDRTLIDALEPFISTLSHTGDVMEAARAAQDGADKTKSMEASLGRSVYVGGDGWREVPDPGAYGLGEFFLGLAEGLR